MKTFAKATLASVLFALTRTSYASDVPLGSFPFKRDGQLILVDARINNSGPFVFVVDTGAPHTIFDPTLAKELGMKIESAPSVTGTGTGQVNKARTAPATMVLHDVKVEVPEPWVIDLSKVPITRTARGLVGAEILKTYVVKIDPLQSTFSVFDPASYRYTGKGASIPLIVENDKLFFEADLEVPAGHVVTHKLRIDTGSESCQRRSREAIG